MTLIKPINLSPSSSDVTRSSTITDFKKLLPLVISQDLNQREPQGTDYSCDPGLILCGVNITSEIMDHP